jgi:hypothetical protein
VVPLSSSDGYGRTQARVQAESIRACRLNARGFSASNRWWMMQFYKTHRGPPKVAPLVRVLSGTHNLLIMSRSKRDEERELYLRLCVKERWSKRQLERQLAGALFERVALSPAKLSPPVRELHPQLRQPSLLTFQRAEEPSAAVGPSGNWIGRFARLRRFVGASSNSWNSRMRGVAEAEMILSRTRCAVMRGKMSIFL